LPDFCHTKIQIQAGFSRFRQKNGLFLPEMGKNRPIFTPDEFLYDKNSKIG